ncbi:TIGR04326 family surface carbohydrate biosynthesis protein [uncultured Desulfobacter sp.]|uniref:TIGR04326 family surface carbohydrate biosynthesis protein n=1 Tax=uncultured Desulfobacter sp. TaxID=240139 RepID=UPI002AABA2EF|nr:TIGR04326 family surface carbohydrate biosynthesis protein [uncultured Desulfobacter sp.]
MELIVWDSDEHPSPPDDTIVVYWNGFENEQVPQSIYIPSLVEKDADELKAQYLSWVYDFGEQRVGGRKIVERMKIRSGFSYWWMTIIADKCNWAVSFQISNAIKLMAFEKICLKYSPEKIVLYSQDEALAEACSLWLKRIKVDFQWKNSRKKDSVSKFSKDKMVEWMPYPIQALIVLIQKIVIECPLRKVGLEEIRHFDSKLTFFSYFSKPDQDAFVKGQFRSMYWGNIDTLLGKIPEKIAWIHKYVKHPFVSNAFQCRRLLKRLNQFEDGKQVHTTMAAALNGPIIFKTLIDFIKVIRIGLRLNRICDCFKPAGSELDFWPLFKQDWGKSMFGSWALQNCLDLNLMEATIGQLPKQKMGFFLQENQPWEKALSYVWKEKGHGKLVGVPHTTICYWDLRYFNDPRSCQAGGPEPLPDLSALNGPVAIKNFCQTGYPKEKIVEVEALRYLYLNDIVEAKQQSKLPQNTLKVLVLTDYSKQVTIQQMQWLEKARPLLNRNVFFVIKPHPNCPVRLQDYPLLEGDAIVSTDFISEVLTDCDIAYTSTATSAAVDAYCAGVPIISMLDGKSLNLSPLRDVEDVCFVTSPKALAEKLITEIPQRKDKIKPYFFLGTTLERWEEILYQLMEDADRT